MYRNLFLIETFLYIKGERIGDANLSKGEKMKKPEIMKLFFGISTKPVTNTELMDLLKNDKKSYDEFVTEAARQLGVNID